MNYLLAFLGIAIFFIGKYAGRNDKQKDFSFTFWLKDNWPEAVTSVLATIALLIIFLSPEAVYDFDTLIDKIPGVVSLPVKMVVALLVGLGNSALLYKMFKTKVS
jgi:hypothetical protein